MCCLYPLEGSLAPGIQQPSREDQDEDDTLQYHIELEVIVCDRPWKQEYRLDVEDHEDQGEYVILTPKLNVGIAFGFDSTFVDRLFHRIGFFRGEQPVGRNRDSREQESRTEKHGDEDPGFEHR